MAEVKNKQASKKNNAKKSNTAKKQPAKKPSKAELEQLRMEEEIKKAERIKKRNQTAAIIIFASSLLFLSLVLIPAAVGSAWYYVRGFIFGLLGYSAFILPFVMFYTAIMLSMEKLAQSVGIKIMQGCLMTLFISSLAFVIAHVGEINFVRDISNEFYKYFDAGKIGWGLFGGIIGEAFMLLGSSKAPAIALSSICIFVSFMFLSGFTLMKLINQLSKPAKKVGEKIESAKNEKVFEEYDDEYEYDEPSSKVVNIFPTEDEEKDSANKKNSKGKKVAQAEPSKEEVNDENNEPVVEDIFAMAVKKQEENEEKKLSKSEIDAAGEMVKAEIEESEEKGNDDNYILPPLDCLNMPVRSTRAASQADLKDTADKLINALHSFNVEAKVVEVVPGPSVTRYELAPAPGVKISKFTGLADDLALHLAAPAGVRIEAPIPNKSAIGIEVPNRGRTTVTMREIVDSDIYQKAAAKSKLSVALGKDIAGNVVCADLAKMPHLLIAGTTGSGKSVCLNAMIVSILYNAKPSEVKLLLIDPKQVEFSVYNDIPHLLVPVVSDARKAAGALGWAVTEMLSRYKTLNDNGVRDIGAYNKLCEEKPELNKMSQIVIVIDELSDLMSVAPSEVEGSITRLAQMARAAGMHLVVATQRPSVDVITGLIKANIPSRVALSVSSQVDSRTILDASGAEKLLGLGDMLFCPVGTSKPHRVQGCYLSDPEIERVVEFVKNQETSSYSEDIQQEIDKQALTTASKKSKDAPSGEAMSDTDNEIVMRAAELVIDNPDKASISSLQRHLSLGFAKAGRIMDALEDRGVVGPHAGSKPRKVLLSKGQWLQMNSPEGANDDLDDIPFDTDEGDSDDE